MRVATLSLIAFSAIMGMASVEIGSALTKDDRGEAASVTPDYADFEAKTALKKVSVNTDDKSAEITLGLDGAEKNNIAVEDSQAKAEIKAQELSPATEESEHMPRRRRFDDAERRQQRWSERRRGRQAEWPYFGQGQKETEPSIKEGKLAASQLSKPEDKDIQITELEPKLETGLRALPMAPIVPPLEMSLTPSLSLTELAESFENRIDKHIDRFAGSLLRARRKNEDLFAQFDDGFDLDDGEDLRSAARLMEDVIAEGGVISNLADMLVDIAEDIEIEDEKDRLTLNFEGKRVGSITRQNRGESEHYQIEGLGQFISLMTQTVMVDGEPRRRLTLDLSEAGSAEDQSEDLPD